MSNPTIQSYKLPVTDVDTQLRNFPGYAMRVLTEADIVEAMEGGTSDTLPCAEERNMLPGDKR